MGCLALGAPLRAEHLLLISIDTLRADHLGAYGYGRPTSPHIDELAAEGHVFETVVAQRALSAPSLTSIMTSLYPFQHGVRGNGLRRGFYDVTLASFLKEQGYATAVFSGNHLNTPRLGFDFAYGRGEPEYTADVERLDAGKHGRPVDVALTRRAVRWIREDRSPKKFVWIHLVAPHKPYAPPAPYDAMFAAGGRPRSELERLNDAYDGEIRFVDDLISQVVEAFKAEGLWDDTLTVLTSDHGEGLHLGERYRYHGDSIQAAALRIPLIIRRPGGSTGRRRVPGLMESVDIAPTVLDLMGFRPPEGFAGVSLRPVMEGRSRSSKKFAFSEIYEPPEQHRYAARSSRYHLVLTFPVDGPVLGVEPLSRELYDLERDPQERRDISARAPAAARELEEALWGWLAAHGAPGRSMEAQLDEDTVRGLHELGYIR